MEFTPLVSDTCSFKGEINNKLVIVAIYVDDGIVASSCEIALNIFIKTLGKELKSREVKQNKFVGFEVSRNDKSTMLHQHAYITSMLERFNLTNAVPDTTPLADTKTLFEYDESEPLTTAPYQELIGSLLYCSCNTRPDVLFAVNFLSRFNNCARDVHWNAAKRILKYLKGTIDYGLEYTKTELLTLDCYSDSDWAGNIKDRKSTSGFITYLSGGPITFSSKQQTIVAQSSCEAEYIASATSAKELIWLKSIIGEFGIKLNATNLHLDSQSTMKLIKNPMFHKQSKHIDIRNHFIRDIYNKNYFSLHYINTKQQRADILTKSLPPKLHKQAFDNLKLTNMKSFLLALALISCLGQAESNMSVQDTVVWRPTQISHISGEKEYNLELEFYNPCERIFGNFTSVPGIDRDLVEVCSSGYKEDITENL